MSWLQIDTKLVTKYPKLTETYASESPAVQCLTMSALNTPRSIDKHDNPSHGTLGHVTVAVKRQVFQHYYLNINTKLVTSEI